jgi:mannosylglycerate hydrolase MGH1-like protein
VTAAARSATAARSDTAASSDTGKWPEGIDGVPDRVRRRAKATLLRNWRGTSTVPAGGLYPHQWSWDSAFIAMGLVHVSTRRALEELASLAGAQWQDGRIPHVVFNRSVAADSYFPGPAFWQPLPQRRGPASRDVATTGLVQPPVHAAALLHVVERGGPQAAGPRLPWLYRRLAAYHDYLFARRRLPSGLVAIAHPWESGLDNSPAWDEALAGVPAPPDGIAALRRDLAHARKGERPTDGDYARYVAIATAYRDRGYRDDDLAGLPFCVADPLFNSMLAWSEWALAGLARRLRLPFRQHEERAAALEDALHRDLFVPDLGCYAARNARTGRRAGARTVGGLAPLLLPGLPEAHRDALLGTLTGPAFRLGDPAVRGVPSYDLTAPDFERTRYWRGPVWVNTSWLVWCGLRRAGADELADGVAHRVIELVDRAGFREYFDPLSGRGLGARDFSWSAALTLDLLDWAK